MLVKQPSKKFVHARQGLKFFFVAEGLLIFSSYMVFAACNRSQTTRKFFNDTPGLKFVLNFYYKTGELCGNTAVQDYDRMTWQAQEELKRRTDTKQ